MPAGVHLHGVGRTRVHLRPSGQPGIQVSGSAAQTRVQGLAVEDATGVGIAAAGAALRLEDVAVENTLAQAGVAPGHGVQVNQGATLELFGCRIAGNAGVGIHATGIGKVTIIDPLFAPPATGATIGIIDPLFVPKSEVVQNQGGGIAIIDPLFLKADTTDDGSLLLQATDVRDNRRFGVALYGAGARLVRTAIRGTQKGAGDLAEGLLVAAGKHAAATPGVNIDAGSAIHGNGRAGVLVLGAAKVEVSGDLSHNLHGGLWAQGKASEVTLTKTARLFQNTSVGIAVTAGAKLVVDGARIEKTLARDFKAKNGGKSGEVGDGIGVFGKASAKVNNAQLLGNVRAAIIGHDVALRSDGSPDLTVTGSVMQGGKYGIVLNGSYGAKATAAAMAPSNDFQGVGESTADNGDLPVETELCSGDCSHEP